MNTYNRCGKGWRFGELRGAMIVALAVGLLGSAARADTFVWIATSSGYATNAANWKTNGVTPPAVCQAPVTTSC